MPKKISIDQLLGKPEPILELTLGNDTFSVYKQDDLPEACYLRLKQAQSELVAQFEKLYPEEAQEQMNTARGKSPTSGKTKKQAAEKADVTLADMVKADGIQVGAYRRFVEAIAQMEPDYLISYPAGVIKELYTLISQAMNATEAEAEAELEEESGGKPEPLKSAEPQPTNSKPPDAVLVAT